MEIHIKNQISLIKDGEEKEWIESVCDQKKFLFAYNGIADINPNPSYKIGEF